MASLKPGFALTLGSYRSSDSEAVGGPTQLVVDRDMAVPAEALELDLMDRSGIALDDAVTVELGHDGERTTVFTGRVAEIRSALTGVRVRALGTMGALLSLRVASLYENQAAGGIVSDLVSQAGLTTGTVDDGPTLPRFAVDRRLSAYQHARGLADRLGYELYTDRGGKVMFHALGAAASLDAAGGLLAAVAGALGLGGPGEGYEVGKHLIGAAARRRTPGPTRLEVGGESPMSSQGDTTAGWLSNTDNDNHGEAGDGDSVALVLDAAARTKDLADRFAAGYHATRGRLAAEVRVTVLGRPSLELGDSIEVTGAADDLVNARGYVRALRHRFGRATGFLTDVRIAVEAA